MFSYLQKEGGTESYEIPPYDGLNRAYVCPRCGETWAKLSFHTEPWPDFLRQPPITSKEEWIPLRVSCPWHLWYKNERAGSLLFEWKRDVFLLGPLALFREMRIALERAGYNNIP